MSSDSSLSGSMAALALHTGDVDAAWMVQEIIRTHPYYAHQAAARLTAAVAWPTGPLRSQPVTAWFGEVRRVLEPDVVPVLHGRHVIAAISLCERPVRRELMRVGLFHALVAERTEKFAMFGPRGRELLSKVPRSRIDDHPEPIVLREAGRPGRRAGLSADGRRAACYAEGDGVADGPGHLITVWNVESGRVTSRLTAPGPVRMARFTPDGLALRVLLRDGRLVEFGLSDPVDGSPAELSGAIDGFVSGAVSADASAACARLSSNAFVVLDIASGGQGIVTTERSLTRICISADGRRIGTATEASVSLYTRHGTQVELESTQSVAADSGAAPWVQGLECATTGPAVATAGGSVFLVGAAGTDRLPYDGTADHVGICADGSLAATVDPKTGRITLLQPETRVVLGTLPAADSGAVRVVFSPDGRRLLSTHEDGSLRIWDVGLEPPGSRLPPSEFTSDSAEGAADLLGRARDVDAFASLIAARTVQPPLSIGVFANWGGGKSWFMGQLRHRVAALAADARAADVRQADLSFHKYIAQVQFNAWHYSETDVMASLVDHVFNRLELGEEDASAPNRAGQVERAATEAAEDARRTADALAGATIRLTELQARRREAEDERADRLQDLQQTAARTAVSGTASTLSRALLPALAEPELREAAHEFVTSVGDARRETRPALLLLSRYLGRGVSPAERMRRLGPLLGLLGLAGLCVVATALISNDTRAALIAVVPALAGVLGLLTRALRRATEPFREARTQVEEGLKPIEATITSLREGESAVTAEVQKLRETHDRKVARLAEKREALAHLRPDEALTDLLGVIRRSGDYSSRLGLVATARRDLEDVSRYVSDTNDRMSRAAATLEDERGVRVSRIVLYVDDLDRCEPEKVATVLQAVHLLLAFPLFVVVVGVDPRWVGRALQKQFPVLLEGIDPNEYLEKIFQIPFWLDNLTDHSTTSMLTGLTSVPAPPPRRAEDRAVPAVADGLGGSDDSPPAHSSAGAAREAAAPDYATDTDDHAKRSRDLNPSGLVLAPHELLAMQQLAGVLTRSPRSVKAFVNIYRLIKVRSDDPDDFADPDRADADYRVVLYLLAQVIGQPETAADVFRTIADLEQHESVPGVPEGWPTLPRLYQARLDDVAQFSFRPVGRPTTNGDALEPVSGTDVAGVPTRPRPTRPTRAQHRSTAARRRRSAPSAATGVSNDR